MKKIVMGIAAVTMAASIFAADFAARTYMTGSLISGSSADGSSVELLKVNEENQKDADALVVSANLDDKAGANFQFWYQYASGEEKAPKIRNANLWFKPVDQLKVTVGDVSVATINETLHYWKDPIGNSISDSRSWNGKYSSFATVEGSGAITLDITPIDGLWIGAGVAPGAGAAFLTIPSEGDATYNAYGIGAKYDLAGATDLPIVIAASWRDAGKDAVKVLAIGGTYGARYAEGFYAYLNARLNFNDGLKGIAIDNHFRFASGAFEAQLRAPVIIRLAGTDEDPSYLEFSGKVSYALDGFTPYLLFGSDINNKGEIAFNNFGDDFTLTIQPGVTCNVGACALDVAAKIDISSGSEKTIGWSVPFTASVAF